VALCLFLSLYWPDNRVGDGFHAVTMVAIEYLPSLLALLCGLFYVYPSNSSIVVT
jgi:hypothetical protein